MQAARAASEHWPVSENLRQMMLTYSLATEQGASEERPGLTLVSSGVRFAVFNAAVLSQPAVASEDELGARMSAARRFFSRREVPWSCWYCDGVLDSPLRSHAPLMLQSLGLRPIAEHTGMQAEQLAAPRRALPVLHCRRVWDEKSRRDFCSVSEQVFELPAPVAHSIYGGARLWTGGLIAWVGYSEGRAVCTAATGTSAGAVGLYSVATVPEARGRGFGERITRHALGTARAASGVGLSILHATKAGLPLYERLGYRRIARFSVYVAS